MVLSAIKRSVECNICGGRDFRDYKARGPIQCTNCGSIERTRVLALYLQKYAAFHSGQNVLHLAPERSLFPQIAQVVGPSYDARDVDVERYARLQSNGVSVREFDLCKSCESLPSNYYDLVIHNHVMEHVPCNVTAVLWHLHRSLKPTGLHIFSIPILAGRYEESLAEMEPDERAKKFRHPEHMRNFGRETLLETVGMIFEIQDMLETRLTDEFPKKQLTKYNIPKTRWRRFTGAQPFVLSKSQIKLA